MAYLEPTLFIADLLLFQIILSQIIYKITLIGLKKTLTHTQCAYYLLWIMLYRM